MEKLIIENFAGFNTTFEIPLNKINVFIGKQASGKSIIVKLINFYKKFFYEYRRLLLDGVLSEDIEISLKLQFTKYFPQSTWSPDKQFSITYFFSEIEYLTINRDDNADFGIEFFYSESLNSFKDDIYIFIKRAEKIIDKKEQKDNQKSIFQDERYYLIQSKVDDLLSRKYPKFSQNRVFSAPIFVPAARSFFNTIATNVFTFIENDNPIDPLLASFGARLQTSKYRYERKIHEEIFRHDIDFRKRLDFFNNNMDELLLGKYKVINRKDSIVHSDGRIVELKYASSGQQEVFPLLLVLHELAISGHIFISPSLIVEEPEAHLFPGAQKKIIELIILSINAPNSVYNNYSNQLNITTHSPYVLATLNNLLVLNKVIEKGKTINSIAIETLLKLDLKDLNVYYVNSDGVNSLIDSESGLIDAEFIDNASEEISDEFYKLIELLYEE